VIVGSSGICHGDSNKRKDQGSRESLENKSSWWELKGAGFRRVREKIGRRER